MICHMHDEIITNLQKNDVTCMMYLDLKKTFETGIEILLKNYTLLGLEDHYLKY